MIKHLRYLVVLLLLGAVFLLSGQISQAEITYNYQYQLLTQGKTYPKNANLELKIYIKVENEEVKSGNLIVTYDPNQLQVSEIKKWNIFEITTDQSETGKIKISGTTGTQFSGEAPIAYIYVKTLKDISDLTQVISVSAAPPSNFIQATATPAPTTEPTNNPTESPPTSPTDAITPTEAATPAPTSTVPNCPNIEGSGNFVIVFLPDSYNSVDQFTTDIRTAINTLKSTNLDTNNVNKFTFRYASDISKNYNVHIDERDAGFNTSLASLSSRECNGDAFIVLTAKYANINQSYGAGGFSVMNSKYAVIFNHSLFTLPHELSHALAGIFDEYNMHTQSSMPANFYNCAGSDKARCQEWSSKYPSDTKVGCFPGCGYTDWFRSTEYSVMNNNVDFMNYFNPPSIEMWNSFFARQ